MSSGSYNSHCSDENQTLYHCSYSILHFTLKVTGSIMVRTPAHASRFNTRVTSPYLIQLWKWVPDSLEDWERQAARERGLTPPSYKPGTERSLPFLRTVRSQDYLYSVSCFCLLSVHPSSSLHRVCVSHKSVRPQKDSVFMKYHEAKKLPWSPLFPAQGVVAVGGSQRKVFPRR